jgi:ligand-binding sensor domain-containing protein
MRKYFITAVVCIAACGLSISSFAQEQLWQTFTNMRHAVDLVSSPEGVWAATKGGVLLWDINRKTFRKFTNTEGLSQGKRNNEIVAIGRDRRGRIWMAQATGLIDIFDPAQNRFSRIDDYRERERDVEIFDFLAKGDSMYIALDIGVSLYLVGRSEVKETYKNLGSRFPRASAATALFIDGRELWAAVDGGSPQFSGIARTFLDLPNLQAPESWANYTTQEGLPSSVVRGFAKFSQTIIAATENGVAALNGQRWQDISGNIGNKNILQLLTTTEGGKEVLYAATPVGVYRSEAVGSWALMGNNIATITGMTMDDAGTLWISVDGVGLYEFDRTSQSWRLHEPDGPATNNFSSLTFDEDGNLWCTSSSDGLQIFDGNRWYNYSSKNLRINNVPIANDLRHVAHLANGEHWLGSWGGGIYVVRGNIDALTVTRHLDATSGLLSTAAGTGDPNYPVVRFLKKDDRDIVWLLNYAAANSNALAARSPSDRWMHFSTSDGLRSIEVNVIEIEKRASPDSDRIWIGTQNSGVSVLNYRGTVFNKADDNFRGELDLDDGLLSNRILSLAQDRDGYMWIATDKGLNYWIGEPVEIVRPRYGLISDDIKVIGIDPANNKWIGTSGGISVLSGDDNFTILNHYTVENSFLVSSIITSFAFNPNNGDVWIGTTSGLSRLRTPFTAPKPDLSQLTGYPNPFVLDEETGGCDGKHGFRIINLAEESAVKIFNIAGKLVRSFRNEDVPGAQICWDGRDDSGQLVPSGVYLFVAYIEETGASAVAKVAVIRR